MRLCRPALPLAAALFPQAGGGVFVGFALFVEFHAIHRPGLLGCVVAARDVACDPLRIAFQRIAVVAAAGGRDADRVADGDRDVLVLGEVGGRVDLAIAGDAYLVAAAVGAAEYAPGAEAAVVHDERGAGRPGLVFLLAFQVSDARAAAVPGEMTPVFAGLLCVGFVMRSLRLDAPGDAGYRQGPDDAQLYAIQACATGSISCFTLVPLTRSAMRRS